jgi:hypothetical protein
MLHRKEEKNIGTNEKKWLESIADFPTTSFIIRVCTLSRLTQSAKLFPNYY